MQMLLAAASYTIHVCVFASSHSGKHCNPAGLFAGLQVHLLGTGQPQGQLLLMQARMPGLQYFAAHHDGQLLLLTNHATPDDYQIMTAPVSSPNLPSWQTLVPGRPGIGMTDLDVFATHAVLYERHQGRPAVRLLQLSAKQYKHSPPQSSAASSSSSTGASAALKLEPMTVLCASSHSADDPTDKGADDRIHTSGQSHAEQKALQQLQDLDGSIQPFSYNLYADAATRSKRLTGGHKKFGFSPHAQDSSFTMHLSRRPAHLPPASTSDQRGELSKPQAQQPAWQYVPQAGHENATAHGPHGLQTVCLPSWAMWVEPGGNPDYHSSTVRLHVASPIHPQHVYDCSLATGQMQLLGLQQVEGHDPEQYACSMQHATSPDGTQVSRLPAMRDMVKHLRCCWY